MITQYKLNVPARANLETKEIQIDEDFFTWPETVQAMILGHEIGHLALNTRSEEQASAYARNLLLQTKTQTDIDEGLQWMGQNFPERFGQKWVNFNGGYGGGGFGYGSGGGFGSGFGYGSGGGFGFNPGGYGGSFFSDSEGGMFSGPGWQKVGNVFESLLKNASQNLDSILAILFPGKFNKNGGDENENNQNNQQNIPAPDYTLYYVAGAALLVIVVVIVLMSNNKKS